MLEFGGVASGRVEIIGSCGEVNLVIECKRDERTTRIGGAVARSFAHP